MPAVKLVVGLKVTVEDDFDDEIYQEYTAMSHEARVQATLEMLKEEIPEASSIEVTSYEFTVVEKRDN